MDYFGIREGMPVHSADGKDLGKVVQCNPDGFVIEKGLFFTKDFEAHYDQVALVRNGEATLAVNSDQLSTIH